MNILHVFTGKMSSVLNDGEQSTNEKLIELATFFYKIDMRVSYPEQQYIDELMNSIEWHSPTSIQSYQTKCIAKVNKIIDLPEDNILDYLAQLMKEIADLGAAEKAKILAKDISDADGEIADDEIKYLDFVKSFS